MRRLSILYLKKPEGPAIPFRGAVVPLCVPELVPSRKKRPGPYELIKACIALCAEGYPPTERPPHHGGNR